MADQNESPLVSVVIPTYSRPLFLERAIESAVAQTHRPLEIVVIDDNDPKSKAREETEALMKRVLARRSLKGEAGLTTRYERHRKNRGGSAARNSGAAVAVGEYLAFLDDDDHWLPEKTAVQLQVFAGSEELLGLVYTALRVVDGKGQVLKHRPAKHRGHIAQVLALWNVIGTTSSVLIPRSVFEEVGGFDPAFPARQDLDLWFRVALARPVDFVSEELTIHVRHEEERVTYHYDKKLEARERFYDKYGQFFAEHRTLRAKYLYLNGRFALNHEMHVPARRYFLRSMATWPSFKAAKGIVRSLRPTAADAAVDDATDSED